ncbi:uncharacterized protein LOC143485728 [Brachyhypopomus gauderio]|uniref:uncharacterized protein LOC143485728 n=1 Tax=Brachyhypopomus gauderio TaxID=698409 RepID=UPI004041278B
MTRVLPPFTSLIRIFVMVIGNTMNSHETFVEHLKPSSNLTEVYSVEECDIIMAFVSIVSRAGTDIEAALLKIPATRPVVLVTLHHTFDEYYVAPDSRLCVRNRSDVFAVDCLHHEDQGLLRCLRNDEALRAVKQHLRDLFPEEQRVMRSDNSYRCCHGEAAPYRPPLSTAAVLLLFCDVVYAPQVGGARDPFPPDGRLSVYICLVFVPVDRWSLYP